MQQTGIHNLKVNPKINSGHHNKLEPGQHMGNDNSEDENLALNNEKLGE